MYILLYHIYIILAIQINKNYVKQIKLTAVRGNWALVSVFDIDKTPKTGYMRWRSDEGVIYAFPNIK